jgi:hypothetical protein
MRTAHFEKTIATAPRFTLPEENDGTVEIQFNTQNDEFGWNSMTVDRVLEEYLRKFNWCRYRRTKIRGYACTSDGRGLKAHRFIYYLFHPTAPRDLYISHLNGDMSDNSLSNLALMTKSESNRHRILGNKDNSKFRGVHMSKRTGKWISKISCKRQTDTKIIIYALGHYIDRNDAATAYNIAGAWLHGEFAAPNEVEPTDEESLRNLTLSVRGKLEKRGWTEFE